MQRALTLRLPDANQRRAMQRSVSLAAVVAFAFSCIRTGLGTITFCHIPLDVWNKDGGLSNLTLNLSPCSEAVLSTSHSLFDLHSPDVNKSRSAQTALEEILTLRWRFPSVRYTLSLRSKHYGRPSVNLLLNEAVVIYLSLYLRFFQIDGIDLPLSYVEATPDDQWQHFRNYLSSRGVRVSTTVVDEIEADEFQRVRRISDRLDRIFLAPGGSSFFSPWHRSPVVAVFDSLELNVGIFLKTYTSLNLSLDKLIVGLAIESIQWTDSDQRHVVGDRSALVGRKATLDLLPYWRTCDSMEDDGWLQHDHPTNPFVQAAVAPSRQKWLFQMNPDVVTAKADLMARYGFGGIMLYDLHVDDYLGKCTSSAGEPYPLAKALSRAIKAVATAELDDLHEIADDCIPFLGISSGCSDETGSVRDLPLSSEAENEADPPSTQRVNCSDSTFECTFNQTCIPLWWKCDGQTDCGDGADEADCPEETARGSDSPQLRSLHWQPTDELSVENSTWLESEQIEGRIDILPVVYEDDFNSDYFASEIPFDGANSTDISPAVESPGDSSPESSRSYEHETGADINFTGTPPNPVRAEFAGAGGRTERSETSTESDEYFIDYESLKTELNDGEEHFDDFTTFVETSTAMNQAGTSATVPELDPFEHSSAADEFTEKATEGSGSADYSTGETAQRPGNPTPSIDLNDFTEVPADAPATEYPEEAVAQTQTETNEANDSISSAEDEEYLFDDYESLMTKLLVREEPYDLMDYVQTTTEMNEHSTETRTFTRDPSGVVSTTVSEPDTLEYSGQGSAEFYTEDPSDFSISTEETTESVQYTTTIDSNELIDYFDATDSISDMELFTAWPWEDFTSEEASTQSPISSQTVADSQLEDAAGEPTYSPTFESSTWSPTWSETVESTNAAGSEESTAHWLQMADHLYEDGVTDVDWLLETEDDDYAISTDWETWSLSETVFTETTAPAFPSATETQLIGQTTELPIAVSTAHYEPGDADSDKPCRTGSCGIPGPIPTATGGTPQQQPIVSVTGARNSLIVQINAVLNLPDTGSVAALFDLWTRWNEIPGSPQRCHLAGNSTLLSVLLCGAQVGQQPVETTPSSSFD